MLLYLFHANLTLFINSAFIILFVACFTTPPAAIHPIKIGIPLDKIQILMVQMILPFTYNSPLITSTF